MHLGSQTRQLSADAMTTDRYQSFCCQPNVFSRGALELTFHSLRKPAPKLALQVQNLIAGAHIPAPKTLQADRTRQHYIVEWELDQVAEVIKVLTEEDPAPRSGDRIIQKALMEDWLILGRSLLDSQYL